MSDDWVDVPAPQSGGDDWKDVPSPSSTPDAPAEPVLPVGQRIMRSMGDAGNVLLQGIAGAPQEGMMNAIAGGPMLNVSEAIKRNALNQVIPSNDLVSSSLKEAIQQGTNPVNLMGAMAGSEGVSEAMSNRMVKPNSADITQMIKDANIESQGAKTLIRQSAQADMAKARSSYIQARNQIKSVMDTLDSEAIPNAADKATIEARKGWFGIAKDISTRFGKDYKEAIANEKVDTEQLHEALGNVIEKAGLLDKPQSKWSDAEQRLFDYYQKVAKEVPATSESTQVVMGPSGPQRQTIATGSPTLELSKVDQDMEKLFRPNDNTKYTSGEHILTQLREELSNVLPDASKRIKAVRLKYAPELQMKNESYNIFQPFNKSGTYDTTRGINFFTKYANGAANPDEIRLINSLKKSNPSLVDDLNSVASNKQDLVKQSQNLASKQPEIFQRIRQSAQKQLSDQATSSQGHLAFLDAMRQEALSDESKQAFLKRLLLVGAGAIGGGALTKLGYDIVDHMLPRN